MATLTGRKRRHLDLISTLTNPHLIQEFVAQRVDDHTELPHTVTEGEENRAVQLLLLLRSGSSSPASSEDDDHDEHSEAEDLSDCEQSEREDDQDRHGADKRAKASIVPPTVGLRRSARTRRGVGMADYVWGEEDEEHDEYPEAPMMAVDDEEEEAGDEVDRSDEDNSSSQPIAKSEIKDEMENDDGRNQEADNGQQATDDGDGEEEEDEEEEEEDDEPEEEDFSEGDEYVEPSPASRRSRASRTNARRPSSPPSAAAASYGERTAIAVVTSQKLSPVKSEPMVRTPPLSANVNANAWSPSPVSSSALTSPVSPNGQTFATPSPSTPVGGGAKKTRKPKYSAALEARWEEKFEWLLSYKRVKGNCRVAEGNKEYPGLGKWLSNQKTLCKKGKLKADRKQKLIDVGAIADPASRSSSSARTSGGGGAASSPPSSPMSASSALASPNFAESSLMSPQAPPQDGDEDGQGPISKRRRRATLVVDIDRLPSMSSDQEVDSAGSSPSTSTSAVGLFSATSPFRTTFQGKPLLPSLTFPHPMAPGGLHGHLPTQQPHQQNGGGSFLSFALTSMPPVIFSPYPIMGGSATTNHL